MKGRVVKNISNLAIVKSSEKEFECMMRGKLKQEYDKILVGDEVVFDEKQKVIESILPRKNELLRPPVANIDQVMIVIAPTPAPDFYLVDQIIINAMQNKVKPILILNKKDLQNDLFMRDIESQYTNVVKKRIRTSIEENEGTTKIRKLLKGKLTAIIGQSGVGKTTLINQLVPGLNLKTNELSEKIQRGVNTTRVSEIFSVDTGGEIIDTPGFSLLELKQIEPNQIASFYSEIMRYAEKCKYRTCNHIRQNENDCGVMMALKNGKISPKRYARYVELYNYYLTEWGKRHD